MSEEEELENRVQGCRGFEPVLVNSNSESSATDKAASDCGSCVYFDNMECKVLK